MGTSTAREIARWRGDGDLWLDHCVLADSDLAWMQDVRRLTLWAVKLPPHFLAALPGLEWLDVRGGSGTTADFLRGCRSLRYLQLNQIRGLSDITAVRSLVTLELLSLYGLPRLHVLPSLTPLDRLRRLEAGSLKGISALAPLLDAPGLEEVLLVRAVSLAPDDPDVLAAHPAITRFTWFAEDVPNRVWCPVVERVGKPPVAVAGAAEWFAAR